MPQQTPAQPKLTDLLARFLNQQAQAQRDGLADLGPSAEVTPFEAGPVQPIDPCLAWEEAVAAAAYFQPGAAAKKWPVPPQWGSLVADQEPAIALPFCLGNYPQMVRNFHLILQKNKPAQVPAGPGRSMPALIDWSNQVAAKKQYPHVLLALGTLRLAKNYEPAQVFIKANDALIPPEWRAAWNNEKAALAWHQGQFQAALALWNAMEPAVPVLFNRGMAHLFLDNKGKGRIALNEVVALLPETSAWHHLAQLYITLCGN